MDHKIYSPFSGQKTLCEQYFPTYLTFFYAQKNFDSPFQYLFKVEIDTAEEE